MKCRIVLITLVSMLMSITAIAKELSHGSFPYGTLELRGYPMEMNAEGKFRIYSGAVTFVDGTFTIEGDKISFSDVDGRYACWGKSVNPGIYTWAVRKNKLHLTLINDRCGARRTAFLEAPLKISSPNKP